MRVYKKEHPDGRLELRIFIEVGEKRPLVQGLALVKVQCDKGMRGKLRTTYEFLISLIAAISL